MMSSGNDVPVLTVSAVIPCFNGAEWLAEAIASIQAQTRPVLEIIVVDDGSTDDSVALAERCGARVVKNPVNAGEGHSRNRGFHLATGTVVASLDADDLWLPHHVATLAALLERHPSADAAFAAVQRFGERDELIQGYIPPGDPVNVFWLAFDDWLHTTIGSMVRRDAVLAVGGFAEHERYAADYDFWLRLSPDRLFVSTYEVTSRWRWHGRNQSRNRGRQIEAVYGFRQAFIDRRREANDVDFMDEARRRLPFIWRRDIDSAWYSRDLELLRFLCAYASRSIDGISVAQHLRWRLRSLIPEKLLLARDRWRGRLAQEVG